MASTDQSPSGFTAQEMGFPHAPLPPPGSLPPGGGGYSVPNFLSFSALVQNASRSYLRLFDEAMRDSPTNARAMRRDPVLMGALRARQRPTAQLTWHITPQDETDPAEAEAAKLVEACLHKIPRFQKMKMQCLEAIWFGRYAVEMTMGWKTYKGKQVCVPTDFIPINGDKIRYKWDGTPGVMVYAGYPGTKESTDSGLCHFLHPDERRQYIIHEHEPDDADWTEPEMSGMIHGVGVRGRLYWYWWLKQQIFGMLMNYLQRFASGLTIFYYNASDPQAKQEAENAARQQFSSTALLYPRWNSERPDTNKVERLEVGTASPALLQNLVTEYFDQVMVQYILGQTLSSGSDATGLGSGLADLHADTLSEIIKYDAVDLSETFQTDLVNVMYEYNCPGVEPGTFEFEIDSPNSEELMQYGQILYDWGVPLDEDQAYKISQWTKPKPGGGIVSNIGAMQPAAVGGPEGAPEGVPVAGAAGPPDGSQDQGQPVPYKRKSSLPPLPWKKSISRNGNGQHPKGRKRVYSHPALPRLPARRMSVVA